MQISNEHETAQRADVLLANAYPQYSRAALAKLFEKEVITQQGKPLKPGEKLQPGEIFDADITLLEKPADDIDLPIIYEDDNVIVIDKPSGVISHARGRYWDEPSVASFVRSRIVDLEGERAGIVHRLDRVTSGVMICAKNADTLSFIQKQFSDRKVNKKYRAIVKGEPTLPKGRIDIPIMRNPSDPKTFTVNSQGKHAITEYTTLATHNGYSLVEMHPLTGRTHQIRIHMQHIGHPIVGDHLYRGEAALRLMLHAIYLELTLPGGERRTFTSPVPKEFESYVPMT